MRNIVPIERTVLHAPLAGVNEEPRAMSQLLALCKTSEIESGKALKVEAGGLTLAVFNLNGHFFAMEDVCSHGPGSLSEGFIEGEDIECDFHNGRFNIKTGEVTSPPCMIPQKVYPVTVTDGTVFIDPAA